MILEKTLVMLNEIDDLKAIERYEIATWTSSPAMLSRPNGKRSEAAS
jgi:hypothetical protein